MHRLQLLALALAAGVAASGTSSGPQAAPAGADSSAASPATATASGVVPPPPSPSSPMAPPTAAPSPVPEHADDVVDYVLHATLDPAAHAVAATGTIHWRNASSQPVHELWLHLYLNAFKNDRSDFLRERVGGRGSAAPEAWGSIALRTLALRESEGPATDLLSTLELHRPGDEDETDARVPLPRDVPPGGSLDLDVAFDDQLPTVVERTGYQGHFHMVGQWFPKIARLEADGTWAHFPFHHLAEFYADFGTYDVTIDVPAAYTIGATGPVVDARVADGRRIERHVQGDIHDFAWTAWDRWQTARETIDGVAVTVLYPPGFGDIARRDLDALRFALPYESARYGRYPYGVFTLVHPQDDASEAGGMEYPTLITSDGPWFVPEQVLVPEIVTVHELGHQWFYGLVATNEAAWPFLDEGLNQFAETDAMARWRGAGSAADLWGLRVSDGALQAVASNQAVHDEPVAQAANAFTTGANYAKLVYSRTAAVLDTLARVYGDDAVAGALGRYTRRYPVPASRARRSSSASSRDTLGPPGGGDASRGLLRQGMGGLHRRRDPRELRRSYAVEGRCRSPSRSNSSDGRRDRGARSAGTARENRRPSRGPATASCARR